MSASPTPKIGSGHEPLPSLGDAFQRFTVKAGEQILAAGCPVSLAFAVVEGEVQMVSADGQAVERRGPGNLLGINAILEGKPQTNSAFAATDVTVVTITPQQVAHGLEIADPTMRMMLMTILGNQQLNGLGTVAAGNETLQALNLIAEVRQAIETDAFHLNYQPKIDLASGRLSGFEALIRWNHPEKGPISPGVFIPAIENTDLIFAIGHWTVRQVAATINAWKPLWPTHRHPLRVSVNLSGREFMAEGGIDHLIEDETLRAVAPHMLLEITEGALIAEPERAAQNMQRLVDAGFRIAIDDFGTGYSNLGHLVRWPIHAVKIDRSFVLGMDRDPASFEVIRAIVTLARTLHLDVIAEGIESDADAATLKHLGVRAGQGFHFARPMAEVAARDLVIEWPRYRIGEPASERRVPRRVAGTLLQ